MKITSLAFWVVRLPFRFTFKHSLAARNFSENIIAQAVLENDRGESFEGWGESVPRQYVTGETVDTALHFLSSVSAPRFTGKEFATDEELLRLLTNEFYELGLDREPGGAAFCALELALIDAFAKLQAVRVSSWFGPLQSSESAVARTAAGINYGGVVPFGGSKALKAVLWFYKAYGFKTVKLKVGKDFDSDVECVKLARQILGDAVTIRIDANAAWSAEEAIRFAHRVSEYEIASIEQPVDANDLAGLAKVTDCVRQEVVADESLCTVAQARKLAREKICSGFNIRLSKVGGFLAAAEIVRIARGAGIRCHLGAQVGESGILSAAARSFALSRGPFENYEGSANFFLLKRDLTKENLTAGPGGFGKALIKPGFGVTVLEERLCSLRAGRGENGKSGVMQKTPDVLVRC